MCILPEFHAKVGRYYVTKTTVSDTVSIFAIRIDSVILSSLPKETTFAMSSNCTFLGAFVPRNNATLWKGIDVDFQLKALCSIGTGYAAYFFWGFLELLTLNIGSWSSGKDGVSEQIEGQGDYVCHVSLFDWSLNIM